MGFVFFPMNVVLHLAAHRATGACYKFCSHKIDVYTGLYQKTKRTMIQLVQMK